MPPKPPSPLLPKNKAVRQPALLSPLFAPRSSSSSWSSTAQTPAFRRQLPSNRFSSLKPSPSPILSPSTQPTLLSPIPPLLKPITTMSSLSSPPESLPPNKSSLRAHLKHSLLPLLSEESLASQSHRAQTTILQHLPAWKRAERVSIYLSMPSGEARTEGLVRMALEAGKDVFVPVLCREQQEVVGEGIDVSVEGRKQVGSGTGIDGSGSGSGSVGEGGGVSKAKLDQEQPNKKKKKRKMRMEMLKLHSLEEFENLERDSWGIPSLPHSSLAGRENARGGFGPEGWLSRPGNEEGDEGKRKGENGNEVVEEIGGGLDLIVVPGVAFDREMARMGHGAGFYDGYLTRLITEGGRKKPFLVGLCLAEQVLEPGRILMEEWDWRVDAVATGDGRLLTADGGAWGGD